MSAEQAESNPLQGYFDWQVTTLMLASDISDPISAGDEQAALARRERLEEEVRKLTLSLVPRKYIEDPSLDWPAELMRTITKHTLERAHQIMQLSADAR